MDTVIMSLREKSSPIKYVGDSNYTIQLVRWILKPIGGWPKSADSSRAERLLSNVMSVVILLLVLSPVIPYIAYISLENENLIMKIKAIGPTIFWFATGVKYCSLIFHQSDIMRCLRHVETDWAAAKEIDDREIMLRYAKIGRYMACFSVVFVNSGVFTYEIVQSLTTTVVYVGNGSANVHMLPLPVYSGISDMRHETIYQVTLVLQLISTFVVNSITTGSCSLAAAFAMHACGQLKIQMAWLEHVVDGRRNMHDEVDERLAGVVEQHVRILSFISLTEKLLHEISLVEIVACTLDMCLLGYYIIVEWEVNEPFFCLAYCILLVSFTFNIFIFCYMGELLAEQCMIFGQKSYMIDWYRLPGQKSLSLIMIIAVSNSSVKLTAGNLIELSLSSFSDVIKTSVAYLNMLRKLTT